MHPEDFNRYEPMTKEGPYLEKLQTGLSYLLVAWVALLVTGALSHYAYTHSNEIASFLREHFSGPGARVVFFVTALLLALGMFRLRERQRLLYGAVEIGFSLVSIWHASGQARGDVRYWLGIGAGVYVMIRGLDNWRQGKKARALQG